MQEPRRALPPVKETKTVSQEQKRSIMQPVRIAIMTSHYFGLDYARDIQNCSLGGLSLTCSYFPQNNQPQDGDQAAEIVSADAVWWHAPNTCLLPVSCSLPTAAFAHSIVNTPQQC